METFGTWYDKVTVLNLEIETLEDTITAITDTRENNILVATPIHGSALVILCFNYNADTFVTHYTINQ